MSIVYLGHTIDHEGLHQTNDKVSGIQLAPAPNNVTELKSFLGSVNYYGKFLPDLSTGLSPLHLLLRKQISWKWGPSQDLVIQPIKKMLHSSLLLVQELIFHQYFYGRHFTISTDYKPLPSLMNVKEGHSTYGFSKSLRLSHSKRISIP